MGTVWRAHDQLLDRPVAAKELHVLTHGNHENRTHLRRAIREARAVARVPHPHLVGIHDPVESGDRLWIVMELVDGPSPARPIAETGPLTPERTAAIGLQLLDAPAAVHAVGALHRDVKPASVLLRRDGNTVLTAFGIAALDEGDFLTDTGEFVDSLEYMAPEPVVPGRDHRHGLWRPLSVPQAGRARDPARGGVRGTRPAGAAGAAAPCRRGPAAQAPGGPPFRGGRGFRAAARRGG